MNSLLNRGWLLMCRGEAKRFAAAVHDPEQAQCNVLQRILALCKDSQRGRELLSAVDRYETFKRIKPSEYEDYEPYIAQIKSGARNVLSCENVELLEPTSGSSAATKLIPYTAALRAQFQAAIRPWMAGLFERHPEVMSGQQYWAISPSTEASQSDSQIPVGFDDDAAYLGSLEAWAARKVWAVPGYLRSVRDPNAFEYLTLLFLLRCHDLRLISVWHPSYLTILLDRLAGERVSILQDISAGGVREGLQIPEELRTRLHRDLPPMRRRADELARLYAPGAIWPELKLVSCWSGPRQETWVRRIQDAFPATTIEPKGLIATEGIASFPIDGKQQILAITSHFLEFMDSSGELHPAWDLEEGARYTLHLSTANGFLRYNTHDTVEVTSHRSKTPCIRFVARDDAVSDMVGEKLNDEHVQRVLGKLDVKGFTMLAPWKRGLECGYALITETPVSKQVLARAESGLRENYHYDHARKLGQLLRLSSCVLPDAEREYRRLRASKSIGDVKFPALHRDLGLLEEMNTL